MGVYLDFDNLRFTDQSLDVQDVLDEKLVSDFAIGILFVRERDNPDIYSQHIIFPNCEITLGRLTSNDVVTYNSYSSRKHAAVYADLNKAYIEDLESLNGTYLNGKLLDTVMQLENGDIFELGSSRITFKKL